MSASPFSLARKPWRWLLVIAAAALLLGLLPAHLLARWGPYVLGRALSAYLQTSVSVQGVTGGWWNGVTVQQLTIAEDATAQGLPLMRIEQLTIGLPVVSLLLSSKPLAIHLKTVHIDLRRRQDGQWNLTPLLKTLGTGPSALSHGRALVPRLNRQVTVAIVDGQLRLGEEVEFTNLTMGLHVAEGRLTITQAEADIAGGVIALQGELSLHESTPHKALQWRLAGIRLDQLLGPAFQPVTIAEATGRVTHREDGFALENSVRIPTLALAPGTLGQRRPYLTDVALTCTLRLPPPFARLTTDACRLRAAEAQLSLHDSVVEFSPEPQLALRVEGGLAGSLVGALVPEVPGEFPDPVRVHGQITIPFTGAVWQEMGWRLVVTTDRFVFDDTLTEVQTTVVKSVDRIEIAASMPGVGPAGSTVRAPGGWPSRETAACRYGWITSLFDSRSPLARQEAPISYRV